MLPNVSGGELIVPKVLSTSSTSTEYRALLPYAESRHQGFTSPLPDLRYRQFPDPPSNVRVSHANERTLGVVKASAAQ